MADCTTASRISVSTLPGEYQRMRDLLMPCRVTDARKRNGALWQARAGTLLDHSYRLSLTKLQLIQSSVQVVLPH
jgi:hypothetical protein